MATTDPRQKLIEHGLLPNPNAWTATVSYADEPCEDPRVHLHERSLGTLAGDYQRMFDRYRSQQTRLSQVEATAQRRQAALEWLANNYDLDELALDVIHHATQAPTTRSAEF